MNADTFTISRNNLGNLMKDAIQLYIEYVECYEKEHDEAVACATSEVIASLDAELELYADGSLRKDELTQVIDKSLTQLLNDKKLIQSLMSVFKENQIL